MSIITLSCNLMIYLTLRYNWQLALTEMIIHSYLNDFNYFPLEVELPKVARKSQNRSKIDHLKIGVDGFSYISLIFSYFIC